MKFLHMCVRAQALALIDVGIPIPKIKEQNRIKRSQQEIYPMFDISQLMWPGNSPDLNAIEPAWPYPPTSFAEASSRWLTVWESLEQSQIQVWIEQIPRHIEEMI